MALHPAALALASPPKALVLLFLALALYLVALLTSLDNGLVQPTVGLIHF